ncbi:hypothetical protein PoB_006053200 [Plakobranchus ocellatus]|uniref:Uncharacterized protein n=1 Tax=Plakobranchus ocellatus TaxID=259542 RepID=A0AAV4CQ82_9GAST|nr:hypothetical protein PoB_006053200 [Plakobranchus ocellatus]
MLVLHRYYAKDTADETYQKRVSWIGNDSAHPVTVYEYKCVCPNLRIHGRKTTGNTTDYIKNRTHPLLVKNKRTVEKPGLDNTNPLWMNNCCESVNHILQQAVSWKIRNLSISFTSFILSFKGSSKNLEGLLQIQESLHCAPTSPS